MSESSQFIYFCALSELIDTPIGEKRFYGLMGIIYPIIGSINAGRNEIDVKRRKNHVHMNVFRKEKG